MELSSNSSINTFTSLLTSDIITFVNLKVGRTDIVLELYVEVCRFGQRSPTHPILNRILAFQRHSMPCTLLFNA